MGFFPLRIAKGENAARRSAHLECRFGRSVVQRYAPGGSIANLIWTFFIGVMDIDEGDTKCRVKFCRRET